MSKSECPIEEYYFNHKVYKCKFIDMCCKEHQSICRLNPESKRGKLLLKKIQNERNNC